MLPFDPTGRVRPFAWLRAGSWMVVFALVLAAVGIALALRQVPALAVRPMADAAIRAGEIAAEVRIEFDRRLQDGLQAAGEAYRDHPSAHFTAPGEWPTWIERLFLWDDQTLRLLYAATGPDAATEAAISDWLARRPPGQAMEPGSGGPRRPQVVEVREHGDASAGKLPPKSQPIVLAFLPLERAGSAPATLCAQLGRDRLKADLVEPFIKPTDGLEVVPAEEATSPWSRPLHAAMRFWALQPTRAYQRLQQRTAVGQTLVYVGLTLLALITLLLAMWVLVRVTRREVALAEMKSSFVAGVSHDLKTPLALIRMFSETLESGRVSSEEKKQEYYGVITRESIRLSNLIENILDFARVEAGRKEYVFETLDVGQIVRETYEAYMLQLDHKGFEHHLAVAEDLPPVRADRDAVARALINLLGNAVKYSEDEKYLAIEVSRDTRRNRRGVLISVVDRGIGIVPDDRAHLFEGFFRADDARVRAQGGTGLGLALLKHMVDAHGGSMDVESRLVKGTTFRIFLPAAEGE